MTTITPVLPPCYPRATPRGFSRTAPAFVQFNERPPVPCGDPTQGPAKGRLAAFGGQESGSTSRKAVPLRAPGPLTCTSRKSRWAGLRQSGATAPAPSLSGKTSIPDGGTGFKGHLQKSRLSRGLKSGNLDTVFRCVVCTYRFTISREVWPKIC